MCYIWKWSGSRHENPTKKRKWLHHVPVPNLNQFHVEEVESLEGERKRETPRRSWHWNDFQACSKRLRIIGVIQQPMTYDEVAEYVTTLCPTCGQRLSSWCCNAYVVVKFAVFHAWTTERGRLVLAGSVLGFWWIRVSVYNEVQLSWQRSHASCPSHLK